MLSDSAPLVSIIVPSYNYERSLPRCIEALLNQTYQNTEIIVVDDNSTDKSLAIAQEYPVKVLQSPFNGGPAAARNHGVKVAKGEILFFCDADVELDLDVVEVAVDIMQNDHTILSVCGIYEAEPLFRDSIWEEFRSLQAYMWRITSIGDIGTIMISLSAMRRKTFDAIGYFDTSLKQTEGIDFGERLARKGRIVLTDLMRSRHDDDYKLWPMLKKLWVRSRDRVPFYFQKKGTMGGFESPRRLIATGMAGLVWVCLFGMFWDSSFWIGAATGWIAMLLLERDIYIEVVKRLGVLKLPLFASWYFIFHSAAGFGVFCGLFKFATSSRFRNMFAGWDEPTVQVTQPSFQRTRKRFRFWF